MCEIYKNLNLEDMPGEVWKDIEDFPNYQVSNMGRVKSFCQQKEGKILKQNFVRNNYLSVGLYYNGKTKTFRVHRLVALAFIPNPENKETINHINEVKTDNRVENLEWMTVKENIRWGTGIQRRAESISISVYEYDKQGNFLKEYKSCTSCEEENGYYKGHLWRCASKTGDINYLGDKFYSFEKKNWIKPPETKPFTEEHKRRISEAKTGVKFSEEHRKNISKARAGTLMSEKSKKLRKEKMIAKGTYYGRKWNDKQLKEKSNVVYQLDENNNIIQTYQSTKFCGRTTEFSNSQVSIACRGLRNSKKEKGHKYKGYYWYYESNLPEELRSEVLSD